MQFPEIVEDSKDAATGDAVVEMALEVGAAATCFFE
jgi:hypothetical protein